MMDSNADQEPHVFADFPAAQQTAEPQHVLHQFSGLGLQDLLWMKSVREVHGI